MVKLLTAPIYSLKPLAEQLPSYFKELACYFLEVNKIFKWKRAVNALLEYKKVQILAKKNDTVCHLSITLLHDP